MKNSIEHITKRHSSLRKLPLWVILYLTVLLFVSIFSSFLANNRPILCHFNGETRWPVIEAIKKTRADVQWKEIHYDWAFWPVIRFLPEDIDLEHTDASPPLPLSRDPYGAVHFLGTDELGRDVASGLIHGAGISSFVGIFSMLIALIIGIILGLPAGYYGNKHLILSVFDFISYHIIVFITAYYLFTAYGVLDRFGRYRLIIIIIFVSLIVLIGMKYLHRRYPKMLKLPLDRIIQGFLQLFSSIPGTFLLLVFLAASSSHSIWSAASIIGLLSWPRISNYSRAEVIRIRSTHYIHAAKLKGLNDLSILLRYLLPMVWPTVLTHLIYGIGAAILMESTISFLGLGLGGEYITWGSMLASARHHIDAWWLMLFPGMILFWTIYALHILASTFTKSMYN